MARATTICSVCGALQDLQTRVAYDIDRACKSCRVHTHRATRPPRHFYSTLIGPPQVTRRSAPLDYTMLKAHHQLPWKICGVSFNIGRVRRPDEPNRTGWSPVCGELAALPKNWNGGRYLENIISKDFVKWRRCDPSTGCQDSEREVTSIDRDEKASDDLDLCYEDYGNYVYESEEDDEPLEYTSEVASVQDLEAEDADDSASESDGHYTTQRALYSGKMENASTKAVTPVRTKWMMSLMLKVVGSQPPPAVV